MSIEVAAETLRRWREHPAQFVRECFGAEPDDWQEEVLEAFPHNKRLAMKASRGPGKTTILAWLIWNFLLTRPHPRIACTSVTKDNLSDNLWTECSKWMNKSDILKSAFEWTKTRIVAKDHSETWWASARSWSKSASAEEQASTLAGLHNEYVLFILDESGGIPKAVMAMAEAALATCLEGHIVQAGNPTHLEGPLYDACTTERRLWWIKEISGDPDDPKRSSRVSVEWAREQIEKYGRDNPFVRVSVFGQFPAASLNALIGIDELRAATQRKYRQMDYADQAMLLGVDVARYGDDLSVCFPRQGLQAFAATVWRGIDGNQGAGAVARIWEEMDADACFIDDTGGFGASWIDNLMRLGRAPIPVAFSKAPANGRYVNIRTEMAFQCCEWVKRGGAIPDIPELIAAMSKTNYTFSGDKLLLEPKDAIKTKLGYSPDHFDALMLTFAVPIIRAPRGPFGSKSRHEIEYDPLSRDKTLPNFGQSEYR